MFFPSVDTQPQLDTLPKCGQCGRAKMCFSPRVTQQGKGKRNILFIRSSPTGSEDGTGRFFTDEEGQELRDILDDMGENLENCWYAYAIACHGPRYPQSKDILACRPQVNRIIQACNPAVIVLLGGDAVESVIGVEWGRSIGFADRWVGWTIPSQFRKAWLCPTYSIGELLRDKDTTIRKRLITQHIKTAFRLLKKPCPVFPDMNQEVELIHRPRLGIKRMKGLLSAKGRLAWDIETNCLKPETTGSRIYTCSFCLNGEDTFACPITNESMPMLSRVLRTKGLRKIASNLKFEDRWIRNKLGHRVVNWWWDTMIAAHVLDNRPGITSLKFQSYVHFGIGDYEAAVAHLLKTTGEDGLNSIHKIHAVDLLLYNAKDSLLEYRLAMRQRRLMKKLKEIFV